MKKFVLLLAIIFFCFLGCKQKNNQIPKQFEDAGKWFQRAKAISDKDGGKLWGIPLYAPTLIIDRETNQLISNEADNEGLLTKVGDLFTGTFPADMIIANSTTHFGGKDFVMVGFPLPDSDYERNTLLIHEMFHYLQSKLKMNEMSYDNAHADEMNARIYFKLEWQALEKAITINEKTRQDAIRDALIFRNYRRSLYEQAAESENKFELHEGLPEYTAQTLCSESDNQLKQQLLNRKETLFDSSTFMRSFGYFSGFAYAYLLDETGVDWRKNIHSDDDLGLMLQMACNITLPDDLSQAQDGIKKDYNFDEINQFEQTLNEQKEQEKAQLKAIFLENTTLAIPLMQIKIGFNATNLMPLDDIGTVYPNVIITDDWGKLEVKQGGCLVVSNWSHAIVPATNIDIQQDLIKTADWTLQLNKGYGVEKQGNNYVLKKQ